MGVRVEVVKKRYIIHIRVARGTSPVKIGRHRHPPQKPFLMIRPNDTYHLHPRSLLQGLPILPILPIDLIFILIDIIYYILSLFSLFKVKVKKRYIAHTRSQNRQT